MGLVNFTRIVWDFVTHKINPTNLNRIEKGIDDCVNAINGIGDGTQKLPYVSNAANAGSENLPNHFFHHLHSSGNSVYVHGYPSGYNLTTNAASRFCWRVANGAGGFNQSILDKDGLQLNDDLLLNNAKRINSRDSGGTSRNLIHVGADNKINIGNTVQESFLYYPPNGHLYAWNGSISSRIYHEGFRPPAISLTLLASRTGMAEFTMSTIGSYDMILVVASVTHSASNIKKHSVFIRRADLLNESGLYVPIWNGSAFQVATIVNFPGTNTFAVSWNNSGLSAAITIYGC